MLAISLLNTHLFAIQCFAYRALRIGALACMLLLGSAAQPALQAFASSPLLEEDDPEPLGTISPYWRFEVNQWEGFIVQYAEEHRIDPDLVAALIWKESQGLSWVESSSGAVGLMQVMPFDRGFVHRPTADQLLRPSVNIDWGTRILAEVISQTNGDLFTALAAYNGGWYQTWMDAPQDYSREVISFYAQAVAVRNGYAQPDIDQWGLVIELQGNDAVDLALSPQPGWLLTSHITGPRPTMGRPVIGSVIYSSVSPDGSPWRITMWLLPNE